ncbi:MAG: hypothetical protein NTX65_08660 [Ignavibacteriales bacterium]|nr:hypothetical protein [Ignavibacteriales bacterium]
MEIVDQKKTLNNVAFYLLMSILGFSVLVAVGYLFYAILFS